MAKNYTKSRKSQSRNKATSDPAQGQAISQQDRKLIERYKVQLLPITEIRPSPENSEIYGPTTYDHDPALGVLVRSIKRLGLEEPIIVTRDHYVLSGHRRLFAVLELGWKKVPVRFANVTRANETDYHRLLSEYNPQRIKSVAATLSESLLRTEEDSHDGHSWADYHKAKGNPNIKVMKVAGTKCAEEVGPRQQEFLAAAQEVIESLKDYWPLSVRQVHYKLLNNPPLTQTTKKKGERWRYKNNLACYSKLSSLLVSARYHGDIPWEAIDDATRESKTYQHYANPAGFIGNEVRFFLTGYQRDRMEGQPNHIELIVEKNTLLNIVSDIAENFHIPITALRGYGGPSLWREIEERWRATVANHAGPSEPKCILIIVSDHDPEGLNLADDAVRSLRDNHGIDVIATRPAVTLEQVRQYNLTSNPAKESSTRFRQYVQRTGTNLCWECEALEPDVLRQCVHDAILKVVDVDQLNAVQEREAQEKRDIANIRASLNTKLQQMIVEGDL
jgi:hypothetical protein